MECLLKAPTSSESLEFSAHIEVMRGKAFFCSLTALAASAFHLLSFIAASILALLCSSSNETFYQLNIDLLGCLL